MYIIVCTVLQVHYIHIVQGWLLYFFLKPFSFKVMRISVTHDYCFRSTLCTCTIEIVDATTLNTGRSFLSWRSFSSWKYFISCAWLKTLPRTLMTLFPAFTLYLHVHVHVHVHVGCCKAIDLSGFHVVRKGFFVTSV